MTMKMNSPQAFLLVLTLLQCLTSSTQETCSWTTTSGNQYAPENDADGRLEYSDSGDFATCKQKCVDWPKTPKPCIGIAWAPRGTECTLVHKLGGSTGSVTNYMLECTSDETTTTTKETTTATATTTAASACTMEELGGQDGLTPVAILTATGREACEAVCKYIAECVAYVLTASAAECKIFTSIPQHQTVTGSLYGLKKRCESGSTQQHSCCFTTTDDVDSVSGATYTSLTLGTADLCKDLCQLTKSCSAVSVNSGTKKCSVFPTGHLTITGSSGSTLYKKKACSSSQSNAMNLQFTDVCYSAGPSVASSSASLVTITSLARWRLSVLLLLICR